MPRASLSQTITQKTVLSQQLRQSVELLQLSGPELQRELEVQLLSNPLLKLDEEPEAEDVPSKAEDVGFDRHRKPVSHTTFVNPTISPGAARLPTSKSLTPTAPSAHRRP